MRLVGLLACCIILYSAVNCCNPDWFSHDKRCFRSVKFSHDFRMARRYCQTFRGDLATLIGIDTIEAVTTALLQNSTDAYWLNERSFNETVSPGSCVFIHHDSYEERGEIGLEDCNGGKYFICEVPDENNNYVCPKSWSLYGTTCYKAMSMKSTYKQAVSFCSVQRAQLALLDDIAKEHNAAAVIIGLKEPYLVGAKLLVEQEGLYKWSSGNNFKPSCAECWNNTPGDCIGFSSDLQHPTMFIWMNLNCSTPNNFLCEMPPQIASTTQPTTTTELTTTVAPLRCPVGYNWKMHEESGYCYWETTYETERLNWHQAQQFCQAFGGNLATYYSKDQEDHGLGGAKGHYRGLWFGLKRGEDDNFRWVDNSRLNYTNWEYNEPNLKSRSKFCVMHGSSNSKWELDYCGVKRWFICKAPKQQNPILPDTDMFKKTFCNFTGPSIYRNRWYLNGDHCYLIRETAKYSWDTAQYFCQDNGGHLASVHSYEETDFILQAIATNPNTDFWVGFSARGLDSSFTWSDGTPVDFIYWADDYNETELVNKCAIFDKQRGFWKTEHCNRFLGVICKRGVNASYDFTTPEPTPILPGNCERGWYQLGNKCYKTYGEKWTQRRNWTGAVQSCKEDTASLVSIHSQAEQEFITDLLLDVGTGSWTGLENINKGSVFKWNDDTPLDYTNWNINEPRYYSDEDSDSSLRIPARANLCVELDYTVSQMGKWNDDPCHQQKAYICQRPTNPTLTEPSQKPFVCTNITGWSRLSTSCYGIFEDEVQKLAWVDAQAKCRTFSANLVTFRSPVVSVFLQRRTQIKEEFYWIGMRETKKFKYESVSSQASTYTDWLSGQPQRLSNINNCVAIDGNGKWLVKNCKEKHPFVCELSAEVEEVAVLKDDKNLCPNVSGWIDFGGDSCFYFGFRRMTWDQALFQCYKYGGNLASFHSEEEIQRAKNYLEQQEQTDWWLHIGLGKRADGSFGWVDHSPVDFTYWEDETPGTHYSLGCVQMHPKTLKWRLMSCSDLRRNFVCSFSKKSTSGFRTNNTIDTIMSTEEAVSHKIGASGIIGIMVCVCIVLVVLGGIAYRLFPRSRVQPTLLETDGL